jgi:hypothetical protein
MTDPTDQGTFVFGNRMADCEGRIQPVAGYLKRWDIKRPSPLVLTVRSAWWERLRIVRYGARGRIRNDDFAIRSSGICGERTKAE